MTRRFDHWTPRYIRDRLALMVDEWRRPGRPWLTPLSIEILDAGLGPGDCGLEIGCGRSTRWFAERLGRLISLEGNPQWHARVAGETRDLANLDLRLVADDDACIREIESLDEASLDFCLIDAMARDRAVLAALPRMRPGGLLVVDNVERYLPSASRGPAALTADARPASELWAEFSGRVAGWRRFWTSSGVTDTCIWIVPGDVSGRTPGAGVRPVTSPARQPQAPTSAPG